MCVEHCFSHLCMIRLTALVIESSPKGNDPELLDRNGNGKDGVSFLHVLTG